MDIVRDIIPAKLREIEEEIKSYPKDTVCSWEKLNEIFISIQK